MTPAERTLKISKTIEEVAKAYCRRCWWADQLDLMQHGWVEVLGALARKPVPDEWLGGVVYRISLRCMAHHLWELSSPATGARGGKHFAGLARAGTLALEQRQAPDSSPAGPLEAREREQGIEAAREELFWRVTELYSEFLARTGRQAKGLLFEAVLRVLVDGRGSGESAAAVGTSLNALYQETVRVKALIRDDATCSELLEEIADWRAE